MARLGLGTKVSDSARDGDLYLKHGGSVRWTNEMETGYAGGMSFQAIMPPADGAVVALGGGDPGLTAVATVLRADGGTAQFVLVGVAMGDTTMLTENDSNDSNITV
jgi:hypothetical protein